MMPTTFTECNEATVQDAAVFYASQGLQPVKILAKEKKPFEGAWQEKDYGTPEKAKAAFANHTGNIGIRGDDKGHVEIDCDHVKFAEALLREMPELHDTLQSGGKKADPMGHYIVQADVPFGSKSIIKLGKKDDEGRRPKETYADIRAIGGQIVVAPSIHPEGMQYKWRNNNPILRVKTSRLMDALANVCDELGVKNPFAAVDAPSRTAERDIFKLVKEHVKLSDITGSTAERINCLVHKEETPSKAMRQYHKTNSVCCFSCMFGGDVIALYAEMHGLKPLEAAKKLAEEYGVDIPKYVTEPSDTELRIGYRLFDQDKIVRPIIFPAGNIDGEDYFGFCTPLESECRDEDGKPLGIYKQINSPVLVTSKRRLIETGSLNKMRVELRTEPSPSYELRWELKSMFAYLRGKAPEPDGMDIFNTIRGSYEKCLYFASPEWYDIHALWDIGTYFFTNFYYYPLYELRGVKGTAKTKQFAVSRGFSFNATEEMTNPSEAVLFRDTEERRPTKYIDEAEKLFQIVNGKMVADPRADLLNASYKYTGTVPRMEKEGNRFVKKDYSVYSPTMLGSIAGLQGATEDRAIIQTTTKAPKGDKRANIEPDPFDPIYQKTRNELYIFALTNASKVRELYLTMDNYGLDSRELMLWKPLLAVALLLEKSCSTSLWCDAADANTQADANDAEKRGGAPKSMFERVKAFAQNEAMVKLCDTIYEDSWEWRILLTAAKILKTDQTVLMVKEIHERMRVEFGEQYLPHNKTIVTHLDRFGFRSYKKKIEGGMSYKIPYHLFCQNIETMSPDLYATLASSSVICVSNRGEQSKISMKEADAG